MFEDPSNNSMNRMFNNEGPTTPQTTPETQPAVREEPAPQVSTEPAAPVETATPAEVPKKEKSVLFPLIMVILILCLGGYFAFNFYMNNMKGNSNNTGSSSTEDSTVVENTKTKEKETGKDKEETTEKEETKEETPKSEASTAPENNGTTNTENTTQPENNTSTEVDLIAGTILYLYSGEGNGIGADDVFFRYVSHTGSQLVVDISFNDGPAQRTTFTFGQQKKVDGIKNPIVIEQDPSEEYFLINFK